MMQPNGLLTENEQTSLNHGLFSTKYSAIPELFYTVPEFLSQLQSCFGVKKTCDIIRTAISQEIPSNLEEYVLEEARFLFETYFYLKNLSLFCDYPFSEVRKRCSDDEANKLFYNYFCYSANAFLTQHEQEPVPVNKIRPLSTEYNFPPPAPLSPDSCMLSIKSEKETINQQEATARIELRKTEAGRYILSATELQHCYDLFSKTPEGYTLLCKIEENESSGILPHLYLLLKYRIPKFKQICNLNIIQQIIHHPEQKELFTSFKKIELYAPLPHPSFEDTLKLFLDYKNAPKLKKINDFFLKIEPVFSKFHPPMPRNNRDIILKITTHPNLQEVDKIFSRLYDPCDLMFLEQLLSFNPQHLKAFDEALGRIKTSPVGNRFFSSNIYIKNLIDRYSTENADFISVAEKMIREKFAQNVSLWSDTHASMPADDLEKKHSPRP